MLTSCSGCSAIIETETGGKHRRWCSEACRVATHRRRTCCPLPDRTCPQCGGRYRPSRGRGYCSTECRRAAGNERRRMSQQFQCRDCGEMFDRAPARGQRPLFCLECLYRRRRTTRIGKAIRNMVYERDGGVCQICLGAVEFEEPGPWSPSLDHIVPKSQQSGDIDNSTENLRLAHRWCNSVRGDERHYTDADLRAA